LRLRALELIEEKGHDRQGGQNDFKKALEDVENSEREREARNRSTKGKKREESETDSGEDSVLDLELVKTDPDKLYPLIYYALKRRLKDWEAAMEERPGILLTFSIILASATECVIGEVKRTTQGKLAAATQMQSAEYLKPLFKALRSRVGFWWMDYSTVD